MSLSSKLVHDDYILPLLHGIIGILYNRFSDLWPPALDCLAVLIRKHKELLWTPFVKFIEVHQLKSMSVKDQEQLKPVTEPQCMSQAFLHLFDHFVLFFYRSIPLHPYAVNDPIYPFVLQSLNPRHIMRLYRVYL